jgi:Flp pilus assembly protein TadG
MQFLQRIRAFWNDQSAAVTPLFAGVLIVFAATTTAAYDAAHYTMTKRALESATQSTADALAHMNLSPSESIQSRGQQIFATRMPKYYTQTEFSAATDSQGTVTVRTKGKVNLALISPLNAWVGATGKAGAGSLGNAGTPNIAIVFNIGPGTIGSVPDPTRATTIYGLVNAVRKKIEAEFPNANLAFIPMNEAVRPWTDTEPGSGDALQCIYNRTKVVVGSISYPISYETIPAADTASVRYPIVTCKTDGMPTAMPFRKPSDPGYLTYVNTYLNPDSPANGVLGGCTNLTLGLIHAWRLTEKQANVSQSAIIMITDRGPTVHAEGGTPTLFTNSYGLNKLCKSSGNDVSYNFLTQSVISFLTQATLYYARWPRVLAEIATLSKNAVLKGFIDSIIKKYSVKSSPYIIGVDLVNPINNNIFSPLVVPQIPVVDAMQSVVGKSADDAAVLIMNDLRTGISSVAKANPVVSSN